MVIRRRLLLLAALMSAILSLASTVGAVETDKAFAMIGAEKSVGNFHLYPPFYSNVIAPHAFVARGKVYCAFQNTKGRSVVMVYGPDLSFLHEFGYRGYGPGNLFVPGDLVLDPAGKLYVTQMRKRGVQVYRVIQADADQQNGS